MSAYVQPFGVSDPNASYENGNPALGIEGSIPPAGAIEFAQRELHNLALAGGLTPTNADLHQAQRVIRSGVTEYAVATGSANGLVLTYALPHTGYVTGMRVRVKIATTNSDAVTLNIDGLGAKSVIRQDGAPLSPRSLVAGALATFEYDGTAFRYQDVIPQTQRAFTLFPSTNQTLSNTVETAINFAAPAGGLDLLGFYNGANPSRITMPAGVTRVRISGVLALVPNSSGYRQMRILQNGGSIPAGGRIEVKLPQLGNIATLQITGFPIVVSPGDYFQMLGFHNSGGNLDTDYTSTSFTVEY